MDIKKLMSHSADIEFLELAALKSEKSPVIFRSNQLQSIETKYSEGYGVRVLNNGKIGFSSSSGDVDESVIFNNALDVSKFSTNSNFKYPAFEEKKIEEKIVSYDLEKISQKEMIDLGNEILGKITEMDDLQVEMDIVKTKYREDIINSEGVEKSIEKSVFSVGAYAVKVENDGLLWVGDHFATYNYNENMVKKVLNSISRQLEWSKKRSNPKKSKIMNVVFPPSSLGFLLDSLEMGVNAKNHVKKVSPLCDKLGEKVLGDNITIIDSVSDEQLLGRGSFDREGMPTNDNYLFKNGEFKTIITDIENSIELGINTSGNASGSYGSKPSISAHALSILPGDKAFKEILSNLDEAIYIDGVLGGGQSNMLAGDFAVNVNLGYHLLNGEVQGRVKNLMVSGNVYDLFKNSILSKDIEVCGSYKSPYIIAKLNVSV